MSESLKEYCVRYDRLELLAQWHSAKNGTLTPDEIPSGSHQKIWWRCDKGHEWNAQPYVRSKRGAGCPYCAGKMVAQGEDFQTLYPELAKQWHPLKNGNAQPGQYLSGSHTSVWWCCSQGHAWKAMIKSRVAGSGCPYCSGKAVLPGENDLQTTAPLLAKQWHPTKNGNLLPSQIMPGSTRKIWWLCEKGHEWQAQVYSRTAGKGCPVCNGRVVISGENDLESYDPELAKQWCQEKNGAVFPSQVSVYSNKRVWWQCELGHQWKAAVSSRTFSQKGCPFCSNRKLLVDFNDLKTVDPLVAAQWHPTKNGNLLPSQVMAGSSKRVWWKCTDGHEWKAVVYSRTRAQKCGCPVCAGKAPKKYD